MALSPIDFRSFGRRLLRLFGETRRSRPRRVPGDDFSAAAPETVDAMLRKEAEQEAAFKEVRDRDQQQSARKKKEAEADERVMLAITVSEQSRRLYAELSRQIDDARAPLRRAYQRALEEQQTASENLETARQRSIVLADGRHVYFDRDGRLHGDNRTDIVDPAAIDEARRLLRLKPDATDYETYTEKDDAFMTTTARADQLAETLQKLDDLEEDIMSGKLGPDQLAVAQQRLQDIIGAFPPGAREEYDRMRAATKDGDAVAYRAADPAFDAGLDLREHFRQADTPPGQPGDGNGPTESPDRQIAYREAPKF